MEQPPFRPEPAYSNTIDLCARIVSAYVSNNAVSATELTILVSQVHDTLRGLSEPGEDQISALPEPAVPVTKSVQADCITCLEDGLTFKSLRRHLRTEHGLTPEEYRLKWGLPPDYPMTAPNYSARRSKLAKQSGLGRKTQQ